MTYEDALHYIEETNRLGIRPGLILIKELLSRMGNPEQKLKLLHIAGTNGKGSVFAFCESALIEAGFSVGRYVSPAVTDYLERFTVNRREMTEEEYASYVEQAAACIRDMEAQGLFSPTSFEIETAIAYRYFADKKVDYALIECGMGGAEDATNVMEETEVSVMAQISMDHMQYLGDTLEKIAENKAGIIKRGGTLVSAPQESAAEQVLRKRCEVMGARLVPVEEGELRVISRDLTGTVFSYKGKEYAITLLGEHQVINAATAVEALSTLGTVDDESIRRGLMNTSWPGRLTKVGECPDVYADGAHNAAAWKTLCESVNYYFTNRRKVYIIGVFRDKDYDCMVRTLTGTADHVITITPPTARGLESKVLADLFCAAGVPSREEKDPLTALADARALAGEDGVVIICGSLSFLNHYI